MNVFIINKLKSLIYQHGYATLLNDAKLLSELKEINTSHYLYSLIKMSKQLCIDTLYTFLLKEEIILFSKEVSKLKYKEKLENDLYLLKDEAFQYIRTAYKNIIKPFNIELKERLLKEFRAGGDAKLLNKQYKKEIENFTDITLAPIKVELIERYPEFKDIIPTWMMYI